MKRRVNLLVPITSYEAAQEVISAGASEIYCGVKIPHVNYMGLSMRLDPCSLPSYRELEKVVSYAHKHDVKVLTTTEFPFMAELIRDKVTNHIQSCVKCDIDALIATDIGIVLMIRRMALDVPIYASTYLASINYEAVNLLKKLGVKRVILERQLRVEEICEITRRVKGVETEIFVHGPGCSNINASCYGCPNINVLNESMRRRGAQITSLCKTPYEVSEVGKEDRKENQHLPILDAYTWCSLCVLPELLETGVTGFKVVGRCANREFQVEITQIYRELIDLLEAGQRQAFEKKLLEAKTNKYVIGGCKQKRCYYYHLFHAPYKL